MLSLGAGQMVRQMARSYSFPSLLPWVKKDQTLVPSTGWSIGGLVGRGVRPQDAQSSTEGAMAMQLCTKAHWIVHFKWMSCMVCKS